MSPSLDPRDLERLLRRLTVTPAPEVLWERIQAALKAPPSKRVGLGARPVRPGLAAAAVVAAVLGGSVAGTVRAYRAPSRWAVLPLAGTPSVGGEALRRAGELPAGQWLVTDGGSRAALSVGRIGTAEVGPNSQVRLDRGGLLRHRLTLERGGLRVAIAAPPRLFLVRTPSVLATDLGCAYVLEVDSAGASRVLVTAGWVELEQGGVRSVVPAGLVAEVEIGGRPGTPYPPDLSGPARAALRRLDAGAGDEADLQAIIVALHGPSDLITLRRQSGITLWHLLPRVGRELRPEVYRRLAQLAPVPPGVTREGILALQRPMLERWRRDLSPMWSDEAQFWWTRVARRLWEWTVN